MQLSGKIACVKLVQGANTNGDKATNVQRGKGVFNKYVNPGGGAKLTDAATAIHGLYLTSPSIATAKKMPQVWAQFVSWVDANVNSDKVAVVIPYNSETCNLK